MRTKALRLFLAASMIHLSGCIFLMEPIDEGTPECGQGSCTNDAGECIKTPIGTCRDAQGRCQTLGTDQNCRLCGDVCGAEQSCQSVANQFECVGEIDPPPPSCVFDPTDPTGQDVGCQGTLCHEGDRCAPACDADGECMPGQRCDFGLGGRCITSCTDASCGDGSFCNNDGFCEPLTTECTPACNADQECVKGPLGFECLTPCGAQSACAPGETCEAVGADNALFCVPSRACADTCKPPQPYANMLPWDDRRNNVASAKCEGNECVMSCNSGFEGLGGDPSDGDLKACWTTRETASVSRAASCTSFFSTLENQGIDAHRVYCWGLLQGSRKVPTALPGSQDFIEVATGDDHICALNTSGKVSCIGANDKEQLGQANSTDSTTLVQVNTPKAQGVVAGDDFTCALLTSGQVLCWGDNGENQLGYAGEPKFRSVLFGNSALSGMSTVAAHKEAACAAGNERAMYCWGDYAGRTTSTVGADRLDTRVRPVQIAIGDRHICFLGADQNVYCRGANDLGQLSGLNDNDTQTFKQVNFGLTSPKVLSLSAGGAHNCAVVKRVTGTKLECWGNNSQGQSNPDNNVDHLRGPTAPNINPRQGAQLGDCKLQRLSSALGQEHSCAFIVESCRDAAGGEVLRQATRCWGANNSGQASAARDAKITIPAIVKAYCREGDGQIVECNAE